MTTATQKRSARLKELFSGKGKLIVQVSAPTPSGAKLLERAVYDYIFIGGDVTLVSMTGMPGMSIGLPDRLRIAKLFVGAVGLPVLMDADDMSSRDHQYVRRAVPEYIKAGLAGIDMDDRLVRRRRSSELVFRGGYYREPDVAETISLEAMREKISAAVEAKAPLDPDFVIRARCYVLQTGTGGTQEVIRRFRAYREAGADMLYVLGIKTKEQIKEIVQEVDAPVTTPAYWLSPQEAEEIGLRELRYPYELAGAMYSGGWAHITEVRSRGIEAIKEFKERNKDNPYVGPF